MKTDDLIKNLASDAEPVKPIKPLRDFTLWLSVTIGLTLLLSCSLGLRSDLFSKLSSTLFLLEIFFALSTGVLAALAANWLSVPDIRQQKWVVALPFIPLFGLCAVATYDFSLAPSFDIVRSAYAVVDMLTVAIVPAVILFTMLRKAATTHRWAASIMAIMAVSSFGYVASRLVCRVDEPGQIFTCHLTPMFIIGVIGALFGVRLLKW